MPAYLKTITKKNTMISEHFYVDYPNTTVAPMGESIRNEYNTRGWIENMLDQLYTSLERYRKAKDRKWVYLTQCKIQFYQEKLREGRFVDEKGKMHAHMNEEQVEFIKANYGKMSPSKMASALSIDNRTVYRVIERYQLKRKANEAS